MRAGDWQVRSHGVKTMRWKKLLGGSLGLILTVGVTCCMGTALVFLPALLYVMGKRVKPAETPVTLPLPTPEREAA